MVLGIFSSALKPFKSNVHPSFEFGPGASPIQGFQSPVGDIKVQLSKATNSGVIDVPKDLFAGILEASNDEQSRRAIMMHILDCFTQSKAKAWRRIHAALILTEELVLNGSPSLASEIASGYHFDVLQQLSFLEQFELVSPLRAQAMVRSRAQSVHRLVAPKLAFQDISEVIKQSCSEPIQDKDASEDTASTCSPGESVTTSTTQDCRSDSTPADKQEPIIDFLMYAVQGEWITKKGSNLKISGSVATWSSGSTGSLSVDGEFLYLQFPGDANKYHGQLRVEDGALCWSDGDFWRRPHKRLAMDEEWHGVLTPQKNPLQPASWKKSTTVVHGIVVVGHCSDTETEPSMDEASSQGHKRGQRRTKTRRDRTQESSRTSSEFDRQAGASQDALDLLA